MVKLVHSPGGTDTAGGEARLKPLGSDSHGSSVRSPVPAFWTVNVLLTGVPATAVPKDAGEQ